MTPRRLTVIYVEDNAANLELVRRVLEATGRFEVVGADDGIAGLALVSERLPALVLVDLDIPGMNGFEITRNVRASQDARLRRVPIVAISANVLQDERQAALEAGCNSFFEKPFDIHDFRAEVERLVGAAPAPA
jgi:two-component system cell cycle response regulator DivK